MKKSLCIAVFALVFAASVFCANVDITKGKIRAEFNYLFGGVTEAIMTNHLWITYIDAPLKGNITGTQALAEFQPIYEQYMKENKQPGF
jgi:hypothetical protein